jgi:hypothetical protein
MLLLSNRTTYDAHDSTPVIDSSNVLNETPKASATSALVAPLASICIARLVFVGVISLDGLGVAYFLTRSRSALARIASSLA